MDAVQHYQPLSHALHPPVGASTSTSPDPHYNTFGGHPQLGNGGGPPPNTGAGAPHAEEEEEEEDDDIADGDDAHRHHGSNGSSPHNGSIAQSGGAANDASKSSTTEEPQIIQHQFVDGSVPQKRKPGRPKGSKTKKPRPGEATSTLQGMSASAAPSSKYPGFYQSPPHIAAPQTMHPEVNAHNQQYYEFQWRILNLCSEFYNAAEELLRATSPLVIAQSYGMGPGVTIDPLHMVNEAKTVCDALLANPTQLVSRPPPPMIHSLPAWSAQPYAVTQTQNGTNPPAPGATYPAGYGVPPPQGRYPTAYYTAPPPHPPTHPAPVPTGYYPYAPPPHPAQMAGGVPTHPQQQQQQQPGQPTASQQGQSVSAAGPAGGTRRGH